MSAAKYDFTIEQGTSFKLSLIYKDSNGNIIDLTDWCARLIWKTSSANTQTFVSNNTENLSVYNFDINGPEAKISLLFPASTTNNFDFSTAKYDLELQSPDELYTGGGKYTIRILFGTVTISKRYSQFTSNLECNL
jgi:hypothetical protein